VNYSLSTISSFGLFDYLAHCIKSLLSRIVKEVANLIFSMDVMTSF